MLILISWNAIQYSLKVCNLTVHRFIVPLNEVAKSQNRKIEN